MIEMISLEPSNLNSKELTLAGVLVVFLCYYVNLRGAVCEAAREPLNLNRRALLLKGIPVNFVDALL